jgi:hypothetical protein
MEETEEESCASRLTPFGSWVLLEPHLDRQSTVLVVQGGSYGRRFRQGSGSERIDIIFGWSGGLFGLRADTPTPRGSTDVITWMRNASLGALCPAGPSLLTYLIPGPHVVDVPSHALH